MTRGAKLAWGSLLVAVVAVIAFFLFSGRVSRKLPLASRTLPADVQELRLSMHGKLKVSRAYGHPHSQFGVWGKFSYRFDGTVKIAGVRSRLVSKSYEPFAAFQYQGVKYLVLKPYFFTGDFVFKRLEQGGQLVDVDRRDIPFALRLVEFKDPTTAYLYRAWNLNSLVELGRTKEACDLFDAYAGADIRFAYPDTSQWRSGVLETERRVGVIRTELLEFLESSIGKLNCESGIITLEHMLEASRPDDDPQVIYAIAYAILDQKSEEAKRYLCGFMSRVQAEQIPDDMRLLVFERGYRLSEKLGCDR